MQNSAQNLTTSGENQHEENAKDNGLLTEAPIPS
jgi:hypothetical protein